MAEHPYDEGINDLEASIQVIRADMRINKEQLEDALAREESLKNMIADQNERIKKLNAAIAALTAARQA